MFLFFSWDDTNAAFSFSDDVYIIGNDLVLDANDGGGNIDITFGAINNERLRWSTTNSRFEFNDELRVSDLYVDGADIWLDDDNAGVGNNIDIIATQGTDNDGALRYNATGNEWTLSNDGGAYQTIATGGTATKYLWLEINGAVKTSASNGTVNSGTSPAIQFDSSGNSRIAYAFPVPDDWESGTDIEIEVFWSPEDANAGNIYFTMDYQSWGDGETISGSTSLNSTEAAPAVTLQLTRFTFTIPAAAVAADDMVNIQVSREPGNAADTYANNINVQMLRINYTGKKID